MMLIPPKFETKKWAQENFADCPLGDVRRSHRLTRFAEQAANRPAASLPKMGEDWGGLKGIYRLLDRPEATLPSVTQTHRDHVRQHAGRFLVVSDTTHVDLGWKRKIEDAGPIGPGRGKGFLLHSGLLIDTENRSLVGLAGQVAHVRQKGKISQQNDSQRMKRWRESEMWVELMEQVGQPPEQAQYIHVCDSAADNFEVYCTAKKLGCDFVIRVGRQHRKVLAPTGKKVALSQAITDLPELGQYELHIPQGNSTPARTATLRVSAGPLRIPLPHHRSPRMKSYHGGPIDAWVIVVREVAPPSNAEPIEWVLLTTIPVESFEDAWEIIGFYDDRWLVEEWHKALKTGCSLESRQLRSLESMLPLTGVLSVVAVLLVQLKTAARCEPERPAAELVPILWLNMLQAKHLIQDESITNYEFWRAVAKLGGFLGRRHDGEPVWQTIWRGWQELHTLAEGAELAASYKQTRKCG